MATEVFIPDPNISTSWKIEGTELDVFIQGGEHQEVGGCLEIGQTDSTDDERMFVHICRQSTLEDILALWKEKRPHHG